VSPARARHLVRGLGLFAIVVFATAIVLTLGDPTTDAAELPEIVVMATGITAFAVIGLVIAARTPSNPIGWLYATTVISMIVLIATNEYVIRGLTDLDLPWTGQVQLVSTLMIVPAAASFLLALLLFPTGHLPTRRWRVVGWAIAVGSALAVVGTALQQDVFQVATDLYEVNPAHVPALASWTWLGSAAAIVFMSGAVGAFAAVVVRFRRAQGDERQQLRWLAYAVCLVAVTFVPLVVAAGTRLAEVAWFPFITSLLFAVPAATAIALLRYRLYDLDLVIKKTVIFALTVVLVMAGGIGVLLAISSPITDLAPDETQAVGLTGLAIGALIWPMWNLARRIGDRIVYGGRATPYEALTEFSERLSDAYATDDVLPRMAAVLGESTRAAEARVWLLVGGVFRPEAAWPASALDAVAIRLPADGALPVFGGADVSVEVRHRGELLGALTATSHANDPIDTGRMELMRDLAAQAGIVLRNVRLIEELRASRQRLVAAQDEERRRLERNIHDGAQQQLVALGVKLRLADSLLERDAAKAHEMLAQLQTETQTAIDDLRDLARGIYPPLLADRGLEAALDAQARKSPTPVSVEADGVVRYDQDIEAAVYFSCLEALQNIAKYATASTASIQIAQRNGSLEFIVTDDGAGFDPMTVARGSGLQGMTDRIDAIGGNLTIESAPGAGTTVRGTVPV
jgi:signal transduction histidine kinase